MTDRNTPNDLGTNPATLDHQVLMRVSRQERRDLEAAAAAKGVTLSAFVRTTSVTAARRTIKVAA